MSFCTGVTSFYCPCIKLEMYTDSVPCSVNSKINLFRRYVIPHCYTALLYGTMDTNAGRYNATLCNRLYGNLRFFYHPVLVFFRFYIYSRSRFLVQLFTTIAPRTLRTALNFALSSSFFYIFLVKKTVSHLLYGCASVCLFIETNFLLISSIFCITCFVITRVCVHEEYLKKKYNNLYRDSILYNIYKENKIFNL